MASTPYLVTLPVEILQLIIEHTHASGHWPLAQTCKHIYLHSQPTLDRHREAYRKFRISSDLDPLTVPNLLWSVLSDGIASIDAWHVREFEVWTERDNGVPGKAEVDADTGEIRTLKESEPWQFPNNDVDYFCNKLFKVPDYFPDWGHLDQAREELETGVEDKFLKSFLLAQLPRIQALRYVQRDERENISFNYMCLMIQWCMAAGTLLPGFKSLEKAFIGISLGRSNAMAGQTRPVRQSADDFCALLCLPKLSEVYFSHLDGGFELNDDVTDLFPPGLWPPSSKSSPVQTIILDRVDYPSEKLIEFISMAPRALQSLVIRCRQDRGYSGEIRRHLRCELSKHQRLSLQRLCWLNEDASIGQTALNWMDTDQVIMFDDLRVVSLDLLYVEAKQMPGDEMLSRSKLQEQLLNLLQSHLPAQMEIADFDGIDYDEGAFQNGQFGKHGMDYLDDVVEAMIRSDRYKNLKVIFLERIQDLLSCMENSLFQFSKTIKAAKEREIYVHLKGSTPPPGLIINGEFVPIPTRDCMMTRSFLPDHREHLRPHTFEAAMMREKATS